MQEIIFSRKDDNHGEKGIRSLWILKFDILLSSQKRLFVQFRKMKFYHFWLAMRKIHY